MSIQTFVYRVTKFVLVEARRKYGEKRWCDKDKDYLALYKK